MLIVFGLCQTRKVHSLILGRVASYAPFYGVFSLSFVSKAELALASSLFSRLHHKNFRKKKV
jgi:hypothetical protein